MTNTTGGTARPDQATRALRGNCMGAAVLLLIEFGLGMGVNLYVTVPAHQPFFSTVFARGALAAHAVIAIFLLAAAVAALVRAIRARRVIVWAAVGLVAIVAAAGAGAGFTSSGAAGASFAMALMTAIGLLSYLAAIFALPTA
jgi:hypothetical protein